MRCFGLSIVICCIAACDKRPNVGPSADPSAKPAISASVSVVASVSPDASATADEPVVAHPPPESDAGPPKFPLTLQPLGTFTTAVAKEVVASGSIPAGFDPATSKLAPWVNATERVVTGGAKLRSWDFSMRRAWVLTLERGGVRVAMWRDVSERWTLDEPKEHMLIVRSVKDAKGEVFRQNTIVDLTTLAEHPLPTTDCTRNVIFTDGRAIGYGAPDSASGKVHTSICAFELDGTPIARLLGYLDWEHVRAASLVSDLGFLRSEHDVFYATASNTTHEATYVFTIDIHDKSHVGMFEMEGVSGYGALDMKEFSFARPVVNLIDSQTKAKKPFTAKKIYVR